MVLSEVSHLSCYLKRQRRLSTSGTIISPDQLTSLQVNIQSHFILCLEGNLLICYSVSDHQANLSLTRPLSTLHAQILPPPHDLSAIHPSITNTQICWLHSLTFREYSTRHSPPSQARPGKRIPHLAKTRPRRKDEQSGSQSDQGIFSNHIRK